MLRSQPTSFPALVRAVAASLVVVGGLHAGGASAQEIPLPLPTTTTTTDPGQPTTTTTTVPPSTSSTALPPPTITTSTTEPPPNRPRTPTSTTTTTAPLVTGPDVVISIPPGGDGAPAVEEAIEEGRIPAWALEQMATYQRTGARTTADVLDLLAPLEHIGFTRQDMALVGLGAFPVRGEAVFGDDWWYPRFVPEFHLHEGTDIFADFGTPIAAPVPGVLTMGEGPVGGLYTYLTVEDGTYYYFAHLDAFPDLPDSQRIEDPVEAATHHTRPHDQPVAYRVSAGQVIGTVGDTGNAKGGAPHAHFEIHPGGGEAVNPKPFLDQWLAEAEAAVPEVISLYASQGPKAVVATQRTRAAGDSQFSAPARPLAREILGVSAASAGPGTGVQVMTESLTRAVGRVDWSAYEGASLARPAEELHQLLASALTG